MYRFCSVSTGATTQVARLFICVAVAVLDTTFIHAHVSLGVLCIYGSSRVTV